MVNLQSMLTVFFISACLTIYGQTTSKTNIIDSLQTEKEAFSFVKKYVPEFNGKETFENYRNETRQTADSFGVQNWVKRDIDNNSETDLLIFRADKLPTIFAILSLGGQFLPISTTYFCKYQFVYPIAASINNENVILLYSQDQVDYDRSKKHFVYTDIQCDTLIVKNNLFVNYIRSPKHYRIEKLEVDNDGMCEGNCPRINISIDAKTLTSKGSKEMYWDSKPKSFLGHLTKEQINQILGLLNYSNFSDLKKEYEVGCTDQPTTRLTITYNNGDSKVISDYGSSGNFTLAQIYKIVYGIKWSENKGTQ